MTSPARLVRARSGVLPFVDTAGHLDELSAWIGTPGPFAVCLIGGRGGTGKTRLGVELCEQTRIRAGWLSGMLPRSLDPAGLRDLSDTPNPRLVVIDYAETRLEQLEEVLPFLQRGASQQYPVRLLLLVRKAPQSPSLDWTKVLGGLSEGLESLLDGTHLCILDHAQPTAGERTVLFDTAAMAFASRINPRINLEGVTRPALTGEAFGNPLLIVAAAYLAIHGRQDLPTTRTGLLERLVRHEDGYWASLSSKLNTSEVLRRRVVALATLTGAADETEAALLLRELTDLSDASSERRGELARWVHWLYRGPQWWNPLEPDLLGEYLVSAELGLFPSVLTAVLEHEHPARVVQALDTFARTAAYDQHFAEILRPIFSSNLERLCRMATEQAAQAKDLAQMLGGAGLAGALERAASAIVPDSSVLPAALEILPTGDDVVLNGLTQTLTSQLVDARRQWAAADPAARNHGLAAALNNLSVCLARTGQRAEALTAVTEAVAIYRELAATDPAAWNPDLAAALNTLSVRLAEAGRREEALVAVTEAVKIRRDLASTNPAAQNPHLAGALNNYSNRLAEAGRREEALAAVTEAVKIRRELATADSKAWNPHLAGALNNLSSCLGEVGRRDEALTAITEAMAIYRELAMANPAAWNPHLAVALNNVSNSLAEAGRRDEALTPIRQAVKIRRELATANPAAWSPHLAGALNTLSNRLAETGQHDEALAPIVEAVEIRRELATANPAAWNPHLAAALNNFSNRLAEAGQREDALAPITEAVAIFRELVGINATAWNPDLAAALNTLSSCLTAAGRSDEALAPIVEGVAICRELVAINAAAWNSDLANALDTLSNCLAGAGRSDEALAPITEAVMIYRELASVSPAAWNRDLTTALDTLSRCLAGAGRSAEAEIVQVQIRRLSTPPGE